jgi:hypothetical protein
MALNDEPVRLLPALCRSQNGTYFITNHLYSDTKEANQDLGVCFVRLVTEWQSILKPDEPKASVIPKRWMPKGHK